jgi:hypothetical protein
MQSKLERLARQGSNELVPVIFDEEIAALSAVHSLRQLSG